MRLFMGFIYSFENRHDWLYMKSLVQILIYCYRFICSKNIKIIVKIFFTTKTRFSWEFFFIFYFFFGVSTIGGLI